MKAVLALDPLLPLRSAAAGVGQRFDALAIELAERGWLPDAVLRAGIRRLLAARLDSEARRVAQRAAWIESLHAGPIALATDAANRQHYEVPAAFFEHVMGRHLKYSCGFWPEGVHTLDEAEAAMLALTCERAALADGQDILELGCGWGSLTLWMAERYPHARITAVSNSRTQRRYIQSRLRARGLRNVQLITADMNDFASGPSLNGAFDRVVSVEMFEHMHNWPVLLACVKGWLRAEGRLFLHVFCHRRYSYPFVDEGSDDWMARHFFTGGLMPGADLPMRFQDDLQLARHWWIDGRHYQATCEAWLAGQDRRRDEILRLFAADGDPAEAPRQFRRWRLFFLACSELFGYREGSEWGVGHYLYTR